MKESLCSGSLTTGGDLRPVAGPTQWFLSLSGCLVAFPFTGRRMYLTDAGPWGISHVSRG